MKRIKTPLLILLLLVAVVCAYFAFQGFLRNGLALHLPPLHEAALKGEEAKVWNLLKNGVDVNTQDDSGHAAIYYALKRGQFEIADLLLESGADVTIKSRWVPMTVKESFESFLQDQSSTEDEREDARRALGWLEDRSATLPNDKRYSGDILMKLVEHGLRRHPNATKVKFLSDLGGYRRRVILLYEPAFDGSVGTCHTATIVDERAPAETFGILLECECKDQGKLSGNRAIVVAALKGMDDELLWEPEATIDISKTKPDMVPIEVKHGFSVSIEKKPYGRWVFIGIGCR